MFRRKEDSSQMADKPALSQTAKGVAVAVCHYIDGDLIVLLSHKESR